MHTLGIMKRINNGRWKKKKVSMVPMSETEKADILGDNNPVRNQFKKKRCCQIPADSCNVIICMKKAMG